MGNPQSMDDLKRAHVERQLRPLKGGTVVFGSMSPDGFPVLFVKCRDGKERVLFVQQDDECNGPGAVGIEVVE